jgi:Effector-associated domain 1
MKLSGERRLKLYSALLDAFPDKSSLEQMLSFGLDKKPSADSAVRINRNSENYQNNDTQRFDWKCPQPELANEFYEWRGQLMVESGFVKNPSTKVIAARAWTRNHPEDATELFKTEFLRQRDAKMSHQEREEAIFAKLQRDRNNINNGISQDGKPACGMPPELEARLKEFQENKNKTTYKRRPSTI